MKKLILYGLIIGLGANSANGQVNHINHELGSMEFGISGGINIASNNCVLESSSVGSADFTYGFVGNIFVQHKIIRNLSLRLGIGVVNGGSDTKVPVNGVLASFEIRSVYLDFPILAKYNLVTHGHHVLYGLGGVNVGYLISAKTNGVKMENMRDFDVGLLGGIGMAMPVGSLNLFMEAKYDYGLVNTSDLEGEDLRNRGIRVTAGLIL